MISILIPAYKSERLLKEVFLSSLRHCMFDVQVVMYDNGGNGALEERNFSLSSHGAIIDFVKIGNGINIGLNAALNECAKVATGEYFFLPHTDMYLMPDWDRSLLEACRNLPPTSFLLCSRSIEPSKGHTDFHIIKNYGREFNEFDEERLLKDFKDYKDNTIVTGYRMPFFMHRHLWEKMNGVDSNYFSYCTDDDLVQSSYDVGVRRFWVVNNSLVYHLQGKSNSQQKVDKDSNKPYIYFIDKWRAKGYADVGHPAYYHPKIIPWYIKIK